MSLEEKDKGSGNNKVFWLRHLQGKCLTALFAFKNALEKLCVVNL